LHGAYNFLIANNYIMSVSPHDSFFALKSDQA